MDLDAGEPDRSDRIAERDGRVCVPSGVEKKPLEGTLCLADPVEELPLVVRLARVYAGAKLASTKREARMDLAERFGPVDLGLSSPEELEVRPREDEDSDLAQSSARSFGAVVRMRKRALPRFPSGRSVSVRK